MNQSQIDQIKGHLEVFSSIDLGKLVAQKYKDSADLNNVVVGEYKAKEFASTVKKLITQFSEEIDSTYAKAMPFQYNFHNEYGSGNLHQDLASLLSNINAQNFPASITQLNKLIHYQAINGFWEKTKRKYFRSSEVVVKEDQERIDIVSKHMLEVSKGLTGLIDTISVEKNELENFIRSKNSELSEIESLLVATRLHSNEINEIHNRASSIEERVSATLEQSQEKKSDIDEIRVQVKKQQSELKSLLQDNIGSTESHNKNYEKLVTSFEEKLTLVESKHEYFEERNQYLDDLIEREVGASLFETFKQRKKELVTSIVVWKWTVPITAVATIAWIFFLFGNGDLSNLAWQVITINSLKALPAVGLLFFAISQYVKERNFQEEYAFKSAVALTVNSYADQLQKDENKDKMIMDSVNEIYKSPIHHKVNLKEQNMSISSAKKLIETAKSIIPSTKT